MSAFERFAVVRVPFPFTDRQAQKRRPALVLSQPGFQQACCHLLAAGLAQPPERMPRDPLVWLPLLRHWTNCLGALPGGPGWADVQRSLRSAPLVKPATASDQRRRMAVLVDLETVCSGASLAADR